MEKPHMIQFGMSTLIENRTLEETVVLMSRVDR